MAPLTGHNVNEADHRPAAGPKNLFGGESVHCLAGQKRGSVRNRGWRRVGTPELPAAYGGDPVDLEAGVLL